VLRDRLGQLEDRFFASVFFGSALLFLAMLFAAAAVIGAVMLVASVSEPKLAANTSKMKAARRRLLSSNPMLVDQAAINAGFDFRR
jgi:hypothetical protein